MRRACSLLGVGFADWQRSLRRMPLLSCLQGLVVFMVFRCDAKRAWAEFLAFDLNGRKHGFWEKTQLSYSLITA